GPDDAHEDTPVGADRVGLVRVAYVGDHDRAAERAVLAGVAEPGAEPELRVDATDRLPVALQEAPDLGTVRRRLDGFIPALHATAREERRQASDRGPARRRRRHERVELLERAPER